MMLWWACISITFWIGSNSWFQHITLSDIFDQVIANFQEIHHLNFKLSYFELGLCVSCVSDILFITFL